jgi:CIC family chloride channel protein
VRQHGVVSNDDGSQGASPERDDVDAWLPASSDLDTPPPDDPGLSGLLVLVLVAAVGGAITGLVGGAFRWLLVELDVRRDELLVWAQGSAARWVVPLVVGAGAAALARLVVRWAPEASGSGVQRVEAHIRGEAPPAPPRVLPAKFVGGLLSMGVAGLALGREGPTVQMGASIGAFLSRRFRLSVHDVRTVTCSLGGAGLGVAFNAPLGGSMFVFEEVAHAFRTRLVVATFVGTACAIAVARIVVGGEAVLPVGDVRPGPAWMLLGYAVLGGLLGALGVAYNRVVVRFLDLFDRVAHRTAPEMKAAVIGVVVMAVGIAAPWLIGGGDVLNEDVLVGSVAISTLLVTVAVRWVLGPLSYSAGTPGGLFAPLLVLGAAVGALVGHSVGAVDGSLTTPVAAFAVVGMSSFFTGVVRAPVTGVVLIMEMTAQTSLVLPMVVGAVAALVVATLLKGEPIYDTLRHRMRPATTRSAAA